MSDLVAPAVVVVLLGATATGKTALALVAAEALGAEILSFDASCVYRGLDVGTAKPGPAERRRVRHHLVDVAEPTEAFSAARWTALAETALADLARRRRPAVLVGGTGLYLRSLLRGLVASPPSDPELRQRLEARDRPRPGRLHALLSRLDPATAGRLEPADTFRVARALEHCLATGRPLSADQREWGRADRLPAVKLGLSLARPERERIIRDRAERMLAAGLLEEVAALCAAGVPPEARAFRAIGYREALACLEGRLDRGEVVERIVVATRRYAKRQDTWFRREPGVTWIPSPRDDAERRRAVDGLLGRLRIETGR